MSVDHIAAAEEVAAVAATHAERVDKEAAFPADTVGAAKKTGLLGLLSAADATPFRAAATVIERVARECGSSAMVLTMHYSASAVIDRCGPPEIRADIGSGNHLSTLAFSEAGSRSHFWAPLGTAEVDGDEVELNARKSWITSANHADSYVWSTQSAAVDGGCTLWMVPARTPGLKIAGGFDGIGLRGNDSCPADATDVRLATSQRLGDDGEGLDIMMQSVLPLFNVLISAGSIGFMEAAVAATCRHATATRHEHQDTRLCDLPTIRSYIAQMRIETDKARALWMDTQAALENGREDAMLRVLECKAACGESATQVLDTAMRVCGGAAFRRDVGVERRFRDARASTVMAPTSDQLYDFVGRVSCGMELFG